ncbi:MAG TPA: conjugal transfer protein TraF [Vicinamibacterales bacterium]|nr:conjugal transfer protein TraF [Vicinamibacterales bacterium]
MPPHIRVPFLTAAIVFAAAATASPQVPFESVGTRALGMGGAFVAVADDASATYWNPAGLPGIAFFDASFEVGRQTETDDHGPVLTAGGWRVESTRFAIATPVLAFSYGRLVLGEVRPAVASPCPCEEPAAVPGRAVHAHNMGVTLVQSVTDWVVLGSTLRLLRAGAEPAPVDAEAPVEEAVRHVAQRDVSLSSRFDADIGALAWIGRLRLGLVARNLTAPEIETSSGTLEIERQVRAGLSVGGEPARGQRPWAVALDADLTTIALPDGRRRSLALGAERWWGNRSVALRGGARVQTVDDARPAVSGGISVALRTGLLIEAQATRGEDDHDRGWSAGARLTF